MPFQFARLEICDVVHVEDEAFLDDRGFFKEICKHSEFAENGLPERFVEDNFLSSKRAVLRGLPYQKNPKARGNSWRVFPAASFDAAADIRQGSPTHGRWISGELYGAHRSMVYVPSGFAHGFCVLSSEATVIYKIAAKFSQDFEQGIIWNDRAPAIGWPIAHPILAPKDAALPPLRDAGNNFRFGGII